MTSPTKTHLTQQIKQQGDKETRLLAELKECQELIAGHLKTIDLIQEYELSNTKQDS